MGNVAPSVAALLQKTQLGKRVLTQALAVGKPITYKTPITNIRTVVTPSTRIVKSQEVKSALAVQQINKQVAAGGGSMTGGASPEYGQTLATLAALPVASAAISGTLLSSGGAGVSLGLAGSETGAAGGGLGLSSGGSAAAIGKMGIGAVGKMGEYDAIIGQALGIGGQVLGAVTKKTKYAGKYRRHRGAAYWRNKYEAMYWKAKYEQARYGHGRMK